MPEFVKFELADAQATEALGAGLADRLPVLRQPLVIHLHGELGAGKTTCVRGFLRRLGVAGVVRSPSYTLIEPYAVGLMTCVHVDLYRLRDPGELEDLGLRDYLAPNHVLLIEWPEKGEGFVPPADLHIHIQYSAQGRQVRLQASAEVALGLLEIAGSMS